MDGFGADWAGPVSARSACTFSFIGACCPLRARIPCPSRRSLLPALCSELGQFVLEPLVAAVDQVDSVDGGNALGPQRGDRKSTRLNSSHVAISYAVFCLKKKKKQMHTSRHTDNLRGNA